MSTYRARKTHGLVTSLEKFGCVALLISMGELPGEPPVKMAGCYSLPVKWRVLLVLVFIQSIGQVASGSRL